MFLFKGLLSLAVLLGIAYALSSDRSKIDKRLVIVGISLQIVLALLVFGIPALGISGPLRFFFDAANDAIVAILTFSLEGSRFVFGPLADSKKFGFIFAFQVLPTILFMASLMSILYYLGIMQRVVLVVAIVMQKLMGVSGAESLSGAANIFLGQTEAPLLVKPFVARMTLSELFAVMVGGMATVAGGVMAAYVGLLHERIPDIAGHLLTASVMSAPAAFVMCKIIIPETAVPETLGTIPKSCEAQSHANVIEAAASGAIDGLTLALNVAAMLIVFIALIATVDACLTGFGNLIHFPQWGASLVPHDLIVDGEVKLRLSLIFGWLFAPLAWMMGIPWNEAGIAGALLGEKVALNEFVAYLHLTDQMNQLSERTIVIMSYALCGFANFSSIGIQLGGIGALAPNRRSDLAKLGLRAVIAGSMTTFMTATIAGVLLA